jgi:hypothetical protein
VVSKTLLRLRCCESGRWVIWNHQCYLLAHDVRDIIMGAYVVARSVEDAERVVSLVQARRAAPTSSCLRIFRTRIGADPQPATARPAREPRLPPRWSEPKGRTRASGREPGRRQRRVDACRTAHVRNICRGGLVRTSARLRDSVQSGRPFGWHPPVSAGQQNRRCARLPSASGCRWHAMSMPNVQVSRGSKPRTQAR